MKSKKMNRTEIEEKVRAFLTNEFEIDEDRIFDDAKLKEDMGLDSLDYVDIVAIVYQLFGFRIKLEEMKDVKTFKQFCDYIKEKLATK